jgi:TolA-binding protein
MRVSSSCCWSSAIGLVWLALSSLAFAANRDVIELQVRVRGMSDQAIIMQQSMDEGFGAMNQSLKQTAAELAANGEKLTRFEQALRAKSKAARASSLIPQMSALRQSASRLGVRLQQIEDQVQTLSAEIGHPAQPVVAAGETLPPDVLLRNGMQDYDAGRYKMASQEFAEYLKAYSSKGQAAEAQFYLADCEYWAGDYQRALTDFDKLEQQHPDTKPVTVALKRGLCLIQLGRAEAARDELGRLVERYPNSSEAMEARSELEKLRMEARAIPLF